MCRILQERDSLNKKKKCNEKNEKYHGKNAQLGMQPLLKATYS